MTERHGSLRWGIALLALVLWLAQSGALLHRVVHGTAGEWQAHLSAATDTSRADAGWTADAWGDHAKRTDCQTLDQLCAPALPMQVASVMTPFFAALVLAVATPTWLGLLARFFSAQAPPEAY